MEPVALKNAADLELARGAANGQLPAWHEFVMRYSALIRVLIRRYFHGWPEDDQLNLYVDVLEYFHTQGLRRFDGRAALSTWVMTVTRSRCFDELRHRLGRRRAPTWLLEYSEFHQWLYRLYFIECLTVPAIQSRLQQQGHVMDSAEIERAIDLLLERLDRQSLKRLAYDLQARSIGALSGRVLEVMDQLRLDMETRMEDQRPDLELLQSRTRRLLAEIEECVERLGTIERQVIELRFHDEMSAPGIARRLNLSGPRQAQSLINRALGLLRKMLDPDLDAALTRQPPTVSDLPTEPAQ